MSVDVAAFASTAPCLRPVTLTAVPEPQFYAGAVALGLLGFTVWRRQQKVS